MTYCIKWMKKRSGVGIFFRVFFFGPGLPQEGNQDVKRICKKSEFWKKLKIFTWYVNIFRKSSQKTYADSELRFYQVKILGGCVKMTHLWSVNRRSFSELRFRKFLGGGKSLLRVQKQAAFRGPRAAPRAAPAQPPGGVTGGLPRGAEYPPGLTTDYSVQNLYFGSRAERY
jgi:hypothetical protein